MDYSNVPAYLSTDHGAAVGYVNTAVGAASNPFTSLTAYDPDTDIATMLSRLNTFEGYINELDWDSIYPDIFALAVSIVDEYINSDSYIEDRISAHAASLDTDLAMKAYPKFEAGMRDINAIQTTAFVIGRAAITLDRNDKVDRFSADMYMQSAKDRSTMISQVASELLRIFIQRLEFHRVLTSLNMDFYRIKIAALADEATENKGIEAEEAKFPMAKWQYAANVMAALNGGVNQVQASEGNKTARIIGSALSGASAGAMLASAVSPGGGNEGYGALLGGILAGIGGSM